MSARVAPRASRLTVAASSGQSAAPRVKLRPSVLSRSSPGSIARSSCASVRLATCARSAASTRSALAIGSSISGHSDVRGAGLEAIVEAAAGEERQHAIAQLRPQRALERCPSHEAAADEPSADGTMPMIVRDSAPRHARARRVSRRAPAHRRGAAPHARDRSPRAPRRSRWPADTHRARCSRAAHRSHANAKARAARGPTTPRPARSPCPTATRGTRRGPIIDAAPSAAPCPCPCPCPCPYPSRTRTRLLRALTPTLAALANKTPDDARWRARARARGPFPIFYLRAQ